MATMLAKVLEIERHQVADYARVDYAITKGEDEIAALEELWLGPNELRRETSVVRDRTVLAVREVRKNMAKRAITAKNMQGSLVESLRQRSRFAVADTVDASLRARWAPHAPRQSRPSACSRTATSACARSCSARTGRR